MSSLAWRERSVIKHCQLVANSYRYWTGKEIVENISNEEDLSFQMYHAPFVILSHGKEDDPVFNYGNLKSQELWEVSWENLVGMPSRYSAEPMEEARRWELIKLGRERGVSYIEKALRISTLGNRFYILNVLLFNLINEDEEFCGQAAIFKDWEILD